MGSKQLLEKLNTINSMLDKHKNLIDNSTINAFQEDAEKLSKNIDKVMEKGRTLKLGIVGEVKAGKSSFLNCLIFDGNEILPKAPTPMTAALTKISYGEKPSAKIHFYDEEDWNTISQKANKYDTEIKALYEEEIKRREEEKKRKKRVFSNIETSPEKMPTFEEFEKTRRANLPEMLISCKEVYDMAIKSGIDINSCLGKTEEFESNEGDDKTHIRKLSEYVGANGRYTPIVKYTEIVLSNKMLEGIEVIDTPGLNDPIISRSRVTKNFLIECDAVFILSYCGQFLSDADMEFIYRTLPNNSIDYAVFIGSKMDSAILQYPLKHKPTFREAYIGTRENCNSQAKASISRISGGKGEIIEKLKAADIICTSSVAYTAGLHMQKNEPLEPHEQHMVQNLKDHFPDFKCNAETLIGLSSITDVREKSYGKIRENRDAIIKKRINNIISEQTLNFAGEIDDIILASKNALTDLKTADIEILKERLANIKEGLDSVRIVVRNLFESAATEIRNNLNGLSVEISKEKINHRDISVSTTQETKTTTQTKGILWWKKEINHDKIITTHTANISDAVENLEAYMDSSWKIINDHAQTLINIEKLSNSIKAVVMKVFETSDRYFDEQRILVPLDNALKKLKTLQNFGEMDFGKYEDILYSELNSSSDAEKHGLMYFRTSNVDISNGAVKNDSIPLLRMAQTTAMRKINEDLIAMTNRRADEIEQTLKEEALTFIDSITETIEGNTNKIVEQLSNKEESIMAHESFIKALTEAKKSFIG